jgi:hypothetical protein
MWKVMVGMGCLVCGACGSANVGTPDAIDLNTRNFPWATGAVWSYQISHPMVAPMTGRKRTILGVEDVGPPHAGTLAFRVHVELYTGSKDILEAFYGDLDVSYKTEFYNSSNQLTNTRFEDPFRLKLDESAAHTVTGAKWNETFNETDLVPGQAPMTSSQMITWSVVSDAEPITVIAGSYTALHVQRTDPSRTPPEVVDYWYAKGVGRLKQTGAGEIEELESFTPGPAL